LTFKQKQNRARLKAVAADEGIACALIESMSNSQPHMEERKITWPWMRLVLDLATDLGVTIVKDICSLAGHN